MARFAALSRDHEPAATSRAAAWGASASQALEQLLPPSRASLQLYLSANKLFFFGRSAFAWEFSPHQVKSDGSGHSLARL